MTDYASIPDVLTISDLQKMFQIGRSTAYRLIKTNQVRSIRVGKCIRIPKQFVMEYIQVSGISVEDGQEVCYDGTNVTVQDRGLSKERRVK